MLLKGRNSISPIFLHEGAEGCGVPARASHRQVRYPASLPPCQCHPDEMRRQGLHYPAPVGSEESADTSDTSDTLIATLDIGVDVLMQVVSRTQTEGPHCMLSPKLSGCQRCQARRGEWACRSSTWALSDPHLGGTSHPPAILVGGQQQVVLTPLTPLLDLSKSITVTARGAMPPTMQSCD